MQSIPEANVLAKFSLDKWKEIRAAIVGMVLATDMANHFEYITKFENKINGAGTLLTMPNNLGLNFTESADRQIAMDICMKCADINNASKPLEISQRWSYLIMEEFFQQGDLERSKGLPVSMFMDRQSTNIPKCQVGFIDYIVSPLYKSWDTYLNEDDIFDAIKNLAQNKKHWQR